MRRGQSSCGGLLPAPAEQTQSDEAGGEQRECAGQGRRNWIDAVNREIETEPFAATHRRIKN